MSPSTHAFIFSYPRITFSRHSSFINTSSRPSLKSLFLFDSIAFPRRLTFVRHHSIKYDPPSRFCRTVVRGLITTDYVTPNYTGDIAEDLFISVTYGDSGKFEMLLDALDETGVDAANMVWAGRRFNQSVLLAACSRGRTDMIRILVNRGADCAHRNDFGYGAVRYARKYYDVLRIVEGEEIIRLLVDHGAVDD